MHFSVPGNCYSSIPLVLYAIREGKHCVLTLIYDPLTRPECTSYQNWTLIFSCISDAQLLVDHRRHITPEMTYLVNCCDDNSIITGVALENSFDRNFPYFIFMW